MITQEAIYNEVVRVLRNELMFEGEFSSDTPIDALGLDSIQLMQLFVYMEELFNFEFDADSTIGSVKNLPLHSFAKFVYESATR